MLRTKPSTSVGGLIVLAITLVVAGVTTMVGLTIMDNLDNSYTAGSWEENASLDTKEGLANLSSQFPNIGLVAGAIVILGLLIGGFAVFRGRGGGF